MRSALARVHGGLLLALLVSASLSARAEEVYQTVDVFLSAAFTSAPKPASLWLSEEQRAELQQRVGDDPGFRCRYWAQDGRTVWVLDVVGRDHPITVGIVVSAAGVEDMQVMVYRESRGWEVRHEFFTRQFHGTQLGAQGLDQSIDNITGATLSVRAMKRAAAMALWLHQQVIDA